MDLRKIRAIAAVLSYAVIVSLAAYNLHDQLLGKAVPSAHADTSQPPVPQSAQEPVSSAPAASTEPAVSAAPSQTTAQPEPAEKPASSSTASSTTHQQTTAASSHGSQASIPVAGNGAVTVGERLPNFFLVGLNGNTLNESALHGHKTLFIIVNPQCPHCQKELSLLHHIESEYPAIEPMFASVSPVDQTLPLAQMTGEGDHLYAGAMELARNIGVGHVPFLMLIDEKGVVRWIKEGELDENMFRDILGKFGRGEAITQSWNVVGPDGSPLSAALLGEQA